MTKKIYIIRHGETDYNLQGIVQGRGVNSSLNETGRKQSEAFYNAYKHIPFDIIYTSSMIRTHQTVAGFLNDGLRHISLAALDEIDWGIYEGVAHDPAMHQEYVRIIEQWRKNELTTRIEGGESAADLWNRLLPFRDVLEDSDCKHILVCSHGRSIRALLCALTDTPLSNMDDFPHLNTTLYQLEYGDGKFGIEQFNNTDHLNGKV